MKKSRKVLITAAVILSALFAAGYFLLKSGLVTEELKDYAVSEINKATGKTVSIDRIEIGIFNNVSVIGIYIPVSDEAASEEFVRIKSLVFRFNLIDLVFRKKAMEETLSSIVINSPEIRIIKEKSKLNADEFLKGLKLSGGSAGPGLPVSRAFIENGRVFFEDRDKGYSTSVEEIKGSINYSVKAEQIKAVIFARSKDSSRRNIKFEHIHDTVKNRFTSSVEAREIGAAYVFSYALPENVKTVSGKISVNASASGSEYDPAKMKLKGSVLLAGCGFEAKGLPPFTEAAGRVFFDGDSTEAKDLSFKIAGGTGSLSGAVLYPASGSPSYRVEATLSGADPAAFTDNALKGSVRLTASITGNQERKDGKLLFFWDNGFIGKTPVSSIEAEAVLIRDKLKIERMEGKICGGAMNGAGYALIEGKERKLDFTAELKSAKARELEANNKASGSADLRAEFKGTLDKPVISFRMDSAEIVPGQGQQAVKNLRVTASHGNDKGRLDADFSYAGYEKVKLRAVYEAKDGLKVKPLALTSDDGQIVTVSGGMNKAGNLDFKAVLHGITLSKLKLAYLEGKSVDGLFEGTALLKGTLKAPALSVRAKSDAVIIRGEKNTFAAEAEIGNGGITIKNASYNDNLTGSGEVSVKNRVFSATADVKELNGSQLAEIFGVKMLENGRINGEVRVRKESSGYGGTVGLKASYSKGDFKSAEIDIRGANNEFVINRVAAEQKEGSAFLKGSASVKNNDEFVLSASGEMKNYRLNKKLKAGAVISQNTKITVKGSDVLIENNSGFTGIKMNNRLMPPLDISFKAGGGEIPSFTLKWGEEYSAEAVFTGKESPTVFASVTLKNADLYPWYLLSDMRNGGLAAGSELNGRLEVSGPVNNASVKADILQGKGTISLEGTGAVRKKGLTYEADRVNLKYVLKDADLKSLASVFDDKFKDTGAITGEGAVKGRLSSLASDGKVTMTAGKVFDMPYDDVRLEYELKDGAFYVKNAGLNYRGSFLKIEDSKVDIKKDKEYYAVIKASMRDFVWQGTRYNGPLNFSGRVNSFGKLIIDGSLSSDGFSYNRHRFRPFSLKTEMRDGRLSVKSTVKGYSIMASVLSDSEKITFEYLNIANEAESMQLNAKGNLVHETGDSDLEFTGFGIDPQMVNDLLNWDHKWGGKLNGVVRLSGTLKKGPDFTIDVSIKNGMVDDLEYDVFSGLLTLKDNWLDLSPLGAMTIVKKGKYEITASGRVPVPQNPEAAERMKAVPMDIKISMKEGDLSVLKFLKFIDDAEGPADLSLQINGTKEFPNVNGKIQITKASGRLKYLIKDLKNIYANIIIRDNIMDIFEMRGDTERGTIKVANLDDVKKGGVMKWMKPHEVNWKITSIGDKIRLSDTDYMEYIDGNAEVDLAMTGLLASPQIAGSVKASDMRFRFPVRMKTKDGEDTTVKDNYAKQINFDLNVLIGENVYYFNDIFNNYAQAYAKPSNTPLQIKGKGDAMKLSGNIFLSRGMIKYLNTEFKIDELKESKVFFDGEKRPVLDVQAKAVLRRIELNRGTGVAIDLPGGGSQISGRSAQDLEINMRAWGRFGNLNVDLTSQPVALEKNRLLFILTFGKDTEGAIGAGDALKMADALANSWIKGRTEEWKKYTPFDVLDIKVSDIVPVEQATPENGTPSAKPKVEFGIGKYFTDSIYGRYNIRLMDDPSMLQNFGLEQTLGLEYMLDPSNKLIFDWTARDPYLGAQYEGFLGIETRLQFESWKRKNEQ